MSLDGFGAQLLIVATPVVTGLIGFLLSRLWDNERRRTEEQGKAISNLEDEFVSQLDGLDNKHTEKNQALRDYVDANFVRASSLNQLQNHMDNRFDDLKSLIENGV
jgi:hypothetical protein